ncbi:MAG: amidohydrolase, partial [Thermodesulfobacteriota bacterium]
GRGWDHTLFNQGKWPDKKFLDQLTTLHPVYLTRIDGHVAWVNSPALQEAKIDQNTPDPEGGEIARDKEGNPTGILKENAVDLVANLIPPPTQEDMRKAIQLALAEAQKFGITSIQDNSDLKVLPIYETLAQNGNLTVRVSEWLSFEWVKTPEKFDSLKKTFSEKTNLLKLGPFKGYVDGTLGSRTAYLFEPYADDSSTVGIPQYEQEELDSLILKADKMGYQICFHAIGDKGNYMVLKALEKALLINRRKKSRHRIEHAQVLRLKDIPLFEKLGAIASMQPTHCTSDKRWAQDRLGKERCKGAYAWKSLLINGARLAFGTDWPVEPLNPLIGLYAAVTRKDPQNPEPGAGWYSRECISLMEALKAYTIGAAYAEFQDSLKGSLEVGKLADMVVLTKDIFNLPPEEILTTQVEATIFDGQVIYVRPEE